MYVCWSDSCAQEIPCDCGAECCNGFTTVPRKMGLEGQDIQRGLGNISYKDKLNLVLHHICPYCDGWVEC